MIIDQITLSGKQAYLVDGRDPDNINLAIPSAQGIALPLIGRSPELREGKILEVTGINLTIESADSHDLLDQLQWTDQTLVSIEVRKEMFPGLYKDPYQHRVHNIGGLEDFKRGRLKGLRVVEVEGMPTLVSIGNETSSYTSGIYQMPEPIAISAAAWHLAASRKSPVDGFTYTLQLRYWQNAQNPTAANASNVVLSAPSGSTQPSNPQDNRFREDLDLERITAYQLVFEADVNYDAYLREIHTGPHDAESLGRPLLQSINLLEQVAPAYTFYSLNELLLAADDYNVFLDQNGSSKRIVISLDISASLSADEDGNHEFISLEVGEEFAEKLDHFSARLDAQIFLRPPVADK